MNTYHAVFGYISGFLMLAGMVPYLYSIVITRETRPNRASYGIWMVIGIINLVAYVAAGEKETVWFVVAAAANPVLIFILSFRFGEKQWYRSDTWCLILAVVSIILWRITGNPVLAIATGITADALAVVPTLLKIQRDPTSENLTAWVFGLVSSVCNIIAVNGWTWANGIYTIYMVVGNIIIVVSLATLQRRQKVYT